MGYSLRRLLLLPLLCCLLFASGPNVTHTDAISVKQALDQLCSTGSVLMIAAHPDDENTALISYLARGRNVRTAYLSLTRGEGGQNLIGSEIGPELGIIRTQELLQSRRIDGAQQFFSRAIDFGFTKTANEALEKWGHDAVLGDIVWVIRKFRPDVVVLQFTGTPRDGHGQHQASSILGREAFAAAADPAKYPEQLKYLRPWRARRLMMNLRGFSREAQKEIEKTPQKIDIDLGQYNPLLGYSYGEMAGISRSYNSSQSDGTPRVRGVDKTTLVTVQGPTAQSDLFDGIDTTWSRYPNGEPVAKVLAQAEQRWNPSHPEDVISLLHQARELARAVDDPDAQAKRKDIDEAIAKCAGLWLDFTTSAQEVVSGSPVTLRVTAIRRTPPSIKIEKLEVNGKEFHGSHPAELAEGQPVTFEEKETIDGGTAYTQPYWLIEPPTQNRYSVPDVRLTGEPENPAPLKLTATLQIGGTQVQLERPVLYRYIDRTSGESVKPVAYIPPVSLKPLQATLVFPKAEPKSVQIEVTAHETNAKGIVRMETPAGWKVSPASHDFSLPAAGEGSILTFMLTPTDHAQSGDLKAAVETGGKTIRVGVHRIDYPHFPVQTLFPSADTRVVRTEATTLAKHVGYVMGSGDDVPDALRQLGCEVTILSANDLARGDLDRFDAIVTGIRAYTERPDLVANEHRLFEYVSNGGTLLVQYNRIERDSDNALAHLGPYPISIGHERVTVEEAPVSFQASDPLMSAPNKITEADFAGWVQERGLYFATKWDRHYQTPFETHDPGEKPLHGGTLVTKYGKGVYIFTAFSWFRELPAGVPGAYRIFANFLSASKTMGSSASASTSQLAQSSGGK